MSKGKNFINDVKTTVSKRKPEIFLGLGLGFGLTSTVLAVKATPKALELIEDARYEKDEDLTAAETVKACWKCYIPAATAGVASVACILGANSVNARRTAALTAAYQISETALSEYREKVIETIGEKKEQAIRGKVHKNRLDKNPPQQNTILMTGHGNTLCYDYWTGRYFFSDIDKIKRAQNEFNKDLIDEMCKSLNEFYDLLNLEHVAIGEEIGWTIDKGMVDISFSSQIAGEDTPYTQTPCIVIEHNNPPHYNYANLY